MKNNTAIAALAVALADGTRGVEAGLRVRVGHEPRLVEVAVEKSEVITLRVERGDEVVGGPERVDSGSHPADRKEVIEQGPKVTHVVQVVFCDCDSHIRNDSQSIAR